MKANTKRGIAVTCTLAASAVLAWIGGYDFDHRSPEVASVCVMAIAIAGMIASLPWENSK